jgi:hypothetical protein
MTIKKDELPPKYYNWRNLWYLCKDQIKQHDAIFVSIVEDEVRYETTVDYIKARCFEEFNQTFEKLNRNVHNYMPGNIVILEIREILDGN